MSVHTMMYGFAVVSTLPVTGMLSTRLREPARRMARVDHPVTVGGCGTRPQQRLARMVWPVA